MPDLATMTPERRIAVLEQQVQLLSAALGVTPAQGETPVPDDVIGLAREGQHIEAVRKLRKATGMGLVEASRIVGAARDAT